MRAASRDLFGDDGSKALATLTGRRTLYAFDFDGTLAPIVARPDDARLSPVTVALLRRLAALAPTAIVTGRGLDDVRHRLGFAPLHLIGNHGAEGVPIDAADATSASAAHDDASHRSIVTAWLAQWPAALDTDGVDPGIVLEPKRYSLSVHYRASDDHPMAQAAIVSAIARLDPAPRVIGGKCVFNLLPEGAPDKGRALRSLVTHERCDAAFFIGDDLTDEAAFAGAPASWVTVKVGCADDSAARWCVAGQGDVDRVIGRLIADLDASARATAS